VAAAPQPVPEPAGEPRAEATTGPSDPPPEDFRALVALAEKRKELRLASALRRHVHPVRLERGRLEFRLALSAPRELKDMPGQLGRKLSDWTGERWVVTLSNEPGTATIQEQEQAEERARMGRAERDPLVQAIKSAFPGAEIVRVTGQGEGVGDEDDASDPPAGDGQSPDEAPSPDHAPPEAMDGDMPPPWEDGDPGPFDP
jgi:DNA polymerase-3 subunit gamma/tau